MNPILRAVVLPVLSVVAAALPAQTGTQLLWSNPWSNWTTVESAVCTAPAASVEAADDFDLQGTITRVVFDGNDCFNCMPMIVTGATVRFYDWANGDPGALLQETFVPAGSSALLVDPTNPGGVDVTLPAPFLATGRHFVSVQVHFAGSGTWRIWVSGVGSYQLATAKVRNRLTNGPWGQATLGYAPYAPVFADLTFHLFGQPAGGGGPGSVPCQTWSELATASPAGAGYALLRAVKAFASNDVWSAGSWQQAGIGQSEQYTLTQHWDGASWTQVPSPSPSPAPGLANLILHALDGVATDDLWAAGTFNTQVNGGWVGQQVFAMHWDGAGWTTPPALPLPNTSVGAGISGSAIVDVEAEASDDVWFVGDWLDIVSAASGLTTRPGFLMHWDGSSLQQTVLPIVTNVAHQYFSSVAANGPNDVWVAGGAGVTGNLPGSPVPVLFHFDGSGWTHTPCPTPAHPGWNVNLYHVDMLASNDVWVFGASWTQFPTAQWDNFIAHWNGAAWSLLPGAPLGTGAYCVVHPGEAWAAGTSLWRFDGTAWTLAHTFTAQLGAGVNALDTLGPCEVFGVGGQTRIGHVAPFAARLDAPWYWRTETRLPAQPQHAPATLLSVAPPLLGTTARAAMHDAAGALGSATALSFWVLAALPAATYPAPVLVPFGGTAGGPGGLFVDPATIGYTTPFAPWSASTGPVEHTLPIPNQPTLLGLAVFTQGVLFDAGTPFRVVFTNGLDLYLGW